MTINTPTMTRTTMTMITISIAGAAYRPRRAAQEIPERRAGDR
jgi:hypothetical protein